MTDAIANYGKEVKLDKTYRTRCGHRVRILCVDRNNADRYSVVGLLLQEDGQEELRTWRTTGVYATGIDVSDMDLFEISNYENINVDDVVEVREPGAEPYMAHYAGLSESGRPMVWRNGRTSHTAHTTLPAIPVVHCVKASK